MPELPEVETIKELLNKQIEGKTIASVEILRPQTILGDPNLFSESLKNQTFLSVSRIGKFLIFHLTNDFVIISHLRMEGKYFEYDESEANTKHARVIFHFSDDKKLVYDDSRCFGILKLSSEANYKKEKEIAKLGPEPFDIRDPKYLANKAKRMTIPVKSFLLNQSIMTGLGNIYVDETLYMSMVNPLRRSCDIDSKEWSLILSNARAVLNNAIKSGGSTIKSYHPGKGIDGNFQNKLVCYGKRGKKCIRCGHVFHFTRIGGRGTTYCPFCQIEKKDKLLIGVTGKIASGKSSILDYVKTRGISTISSDAIVADLYKNSEVLAINISEKLNISFPEGRVDKDILREHLAKHPKDIRKLEKIVHPLVEAEILKEVNKIKKSFVFVEVPLLFESKMDKLFDFTIAVDINDDLQLERLKKRNKSSYDALKLINANNKFDSYKDYVDFLIKNNGGLGEFFSQIDAIINKLKPHLN